MKIGVIGLGLIGGSIFKRGKEKHEMIGVSRSVNEEGVSKDYASLKGCDLVFVCTPMNKTLEILDKLENFLDENTIVTTSICLKKGKSFILVRSGLIRAEIDYVDLGQKIGDYYEGTYDETLDRNNKGANYYE